MSIRFVSRIAAGACLLIFLLAAGACSEDADDTAGGPAAQNEQGAATQDFTETSSEWGQSARSEPQRAVISESLPYAEVDEKLVNGHFVFPSDMTEPLPAVLVIHDWWGLNDEVRAFADRLAAEGYIVLAVDLYHGGVAETVDGARRLMLGVVENRKATTENLRQAYTFIDMVAGAPRIATLGFGFGGGWSLDTALMFPDKLDAAVIYYGQVSSDPDVLEALSVPLLGIFGGADAGIRVSSVESFERALKSLGKPAEIKVYPDARHAFANPADDAYDAKAAEDAWEKTLEFLQHHIGEPSTPDGPDDAEATGG